MLVEAKSGGFRARDHGLRAGGLRHARRSRRRTRQRLLRHRRLRGAGADRGRARDPRQRRLFARADRARDVDQPAPDPGRVRRQARRRPSAAGQLGEVDPARDPPRSQGPVRERRRAGGGAARAGGRHETIDVGPRAECGERCHGGASNESGWRPRHAPGDAGANRGRRADSARRCGAGFLFVQRRRRATDAGGIGRRFAATSRCVRAGAAGRRATARSFADAGAAADALTVAPPRGSGLPAAGKSGRRRRRRPRHPKSYPCSVR